MELKEWWERRTRMKDPPTIYSYEWPDSASKIEIAERASDTLLLTLGDDGLERSKTSQRIKIAVISRMFKTYILSGMIIAAMTS